MVLKKLSTVVSRYFNGIILLHFKFPFITGFFCIFPRFGRRICHGIIMISVGITFLLVLLVHKGKKIDGNKRIFVFIYLFIYLFICLDAENHQLQAC